jgi:hypothetical protein
MTAVREKARVKKMSTWSHFQDVDAARLAMALEHGGGCEELRHGRAQNLVHVLARSPDSVRSNIYRLRMRQSFQGAHRTLQGHEKLCGDCFEVLRRACISNWLILGSPDCFSDPRAVPGHKLHLGAKLYVGLSSKTV